jgi:hypothetical protein
LVQATVHTTILQQHWLQQQWLQAAEGSVPAAAVVQVAFKKQQQP